MPRTFKEKSPEDLEVEERARAFAAAGYPFVEDVQALRADEILKAAEQKRTQAESKDDASPAAKPGS
jgi:hypothetical protein